MMLFTLFIFGQIKTRVILNQTCLQNASKILKYATKYNLSTIGLYLTNFNKYSDIILGCNAFYDVSDIDEAFLMPRKPILLDESLMLENMFEKYRLIINLVDVKGIALYEKIKPHVGNSQVFLINFLHSTLEIYLNKNTKLSKLQCNKEIFKNLTSFFSNLTYELTFANVIFPEQGLCSLIFENCLARNIKFGIIVNSLLIKNRLTFIKTGNNQSNVMLPNLKCLLLEMIYGSLTFDLLDIQLFQRVRWLRILRYLLEIETNLMSEFKFLEFIEINILNLEDFFHRGTKWLKYSFYFRGDEEKDLKKRKILRFNK